jgi:hypothetical protein
VTLRAGLASFFALSLLTAPEVQEFAKPKLLSPSEERQWIEAVQNHRTIDGATVLQVLQYTETMRPGKFKFGSIDVGYNGASGDPEGVAIEYWIGMKRLEDDAFLDLGYMIERDGYSLKIIPPGELETTARALEGGRDSFLLLIDKRYEQDCIDVETRAKLC